MSIFCLGASHQHASTSELSTLTDGGTALVMALNDGSLAESGIRGHVLISTCNRWELYLDVVDFHKAREAVLLALGERVPAEIVAKLALHARDEVPRHLFAVAAGLDSMVLGDDQIAHQVKVAVTDEKSNPTGALHRLFAAANTAGKQVSTETNVGGYSRSLASSGITELINRIGEITDEPILLLGTGAFARVVVADLNRRQASNVAVASTTGRAAVFADSHDLRPAADLALELRVAKVVICCSGAATPPITDEVLGHLRNHQLAILDLSLAGNVDAAGAARDDVLLLTLDDIGASQQDTNEAELAQAQALTAAAVEAYLADERRRGADAAIVAVRQHITGLVATEVEAAGQRYDDQTAIAIADALRRVTGTLLHTPTVRAAEAARAGSLDDYVKALYTLYGIEVAR